MLPETGAVLVCVSGGADSMCLLCALLEISRERGFTVGAAHYNHRLRGAESDRDEEFVREQCKAREVPFFPGGGDVRAFASERRLNLEAAARDMRYGFFYETASAAGAVRIATAHTADDNAETLLLNLARGAGAAGMSGIPPKRGILVRPMLGIAREEVMDHIARRGIPFVQDSTNELDIFTRNKIRHSVIPVLKEVNTKFIEAASNAAALSRADEEYLSGLADDFIAEHTAACVCVHSPSSHPRQPTSPNPSALTPRPSQPTSPNASPPTLTPNPSPAPAPSQPTSPNPPALKTCELLGLPSAISGRVIRKLHGGDLAYKHVAAILEACGKGGPPLKLSLPGMDVFIEYGRVVFDNDPEAGFAPADLAEGGSVTIPELGLRISCETLIYGESQHEAPAQVTDSPGQSEGAARIINKSFTSFLFKKVDICGKMTVRSRREGDTIRIPGGNGTKTLKKLFIERRIPARERALVPVLADDAGVLAVYGLGAGSRAAPQPGDPSYKIDFEIVGDQHI